MGLLNAANGLGGLAGAVAGGIDSISQAISGANYGPQDFQKDGFIVPPIPNADGNGLPASKVPSQRLGSATRNMAHWFVPEVGIINMYVNPQQISYNHKKLITPERTKGGYVIQYWGEELTTLQLRGNTGSSGVEGLNVLYEIYRAEQFMFDSIALTMAADSSVTGLSDLIDGAIGSIGGIGGAISNVTSGILGIDPASQSILPRNNPSLATMALGMELYYSGWVFRGFFTSMNYTESAERLGLWEYDIGFTVTQRRGYRTNSFPWQRSAIDGPSDSKVIPLSFTTLNSSNPLNGTNRVAATQSPNGPFSR